MTIPLTLSQPAGPERGGVIVVQEAFGVTGHIASVCRRFADAGWIAVAPHLFHRVGDPVLAYDDLQTALPLVNGLDTTEIAADIDAAIDALGAGGLTPERIAVVGFCMGGSVAYYTAARRKLGAAATFYGGGIAKGRFGNPPMTDLADQLQTPWLGLYGEADSGIPTDEVEHLNAAVANAAVETSVVLYPQAQHGFHCDDRPAVYNAFAAADAWDRTLRWFDRHVR